MGKIGFWCCVPECNSVYTKGRDEKNTVKFSLVPDPSRLKSRHLQMLAKTRLAAWKKVISDDLSGNQKICRRHFISGSPAIMTDTRSVDWIPSLFVRGKVPDVSNDDAALSDASSCSYEIPEELRKTCHTCLQPSMNLIPIADEFIDPDAVTGSGRTWTSLLGIMISKHFWFEMQDLLNGFVCSRCLAKIEDFHNFYSEIERVHEHQQHIHVAQVKDKVMADKADNEPKALKSGDQNGYLQSDIDKYNYDPLRESDETKPCLLMEVEEEGEEENDEEKTVEIKTNKKVIQPRPKLSGDESLPEINDKNDQMIAQYVDMNCDQCSLEFRTFADLQLHASIAHPRPAYVFCCTRKFNTKNRLLQHILVHLNPDRFQCDICKRNCIDNDSLKRHKLTAHTPLEGRTYKCDKCEKTFVGQSFLNSHLRCHLAIERKEHGCKHCDKYYGNASLLRAHTRKHHPTTYEFVCDICAKGFNQQSVFLRHLQEHGLQAPPEKRVECSICSQWVIKVNISAHMLRHTSPSCICDLCGKKSPNMMAHKDHMRLEHTEPKHTCHFCGKSFKRSIIMKEHVALHTGEALYTCAYCPKTFKSNANWHAHRKKKHPEEWLEAKKRRLTRLVNLNDLPTTESVGGQVTDNGVKVGIQMSPGWLAGQNNNSGSPAQLTNTNSTDWIPTIYVMGSEQADAAYDEAVLSDGSSCSYEVPVMTPERPKTCYTCLQPAMNLIPIADEIGNFNAEEGEERKWTSYRGTMISKHFWFKIEDLRNGSVCSRCLAKIEDFNQFYCEIERAHSHPPNIAVTQIKDEAGSTQMTSQSCDQDRFLQSEEDEYDYEPPCDIELKPSLIMEVEDEEEGDMGHEKESEITTKAKVTKPRPKRDENWVSLAVRIERNDQIIAQYVNMHCDQCSLEFKTFAELQLHASKDHPRAAYVFCCNRKFNTRSRLFEHIQVHLNPDVFQCDVCKRNCVDNESLKRHKLTAHTPVERKTFKCHKCEKSFFGQAFLNSHLRGHLAVERKEYGCKLCGKYYGNASLLRTHTKKHVTMTFKFECETCSKKFNQRGVFLRHLQEHGITAEVPLGEKTFQCNKCEKAFLNQEFLNSHLKRHLAIERKEFGCLHCDVYYGTASRLGTHVKKHHATPYTLVCEACGKGFNQRTVYLRHLQGHGLKAPEERVECSICSQWLLKVSMNDHMQRHTTPSCICDLCGKKSPNLMAHKNHMRIDHTEPKHTCHICGKSFKLSLLLKEHVAAHSGKAMYTCPHCPKTFKFNANMHAHRKKMHYEEWLEAKMNRFAKPVNLNDLPTMECVVEQVTEETGDPAGMEMSTEWEFLD